MKKKKKGRPYKDDARHSDMQRAINASRRESGALLFYHRVGGEGRRAWCVTCALLCCARAGPEAAAARAEAELQAALRASEQLEADKVYSATTEEEQLAMALAASQAPDIDEDLAAALKASMSDSAVPSGRTSGGRVDEMSEEEMLKLALEQSARDAEIYAAAFGDP
jgi:MoxR-like ATPase